MTASIETPADRDLGLQGHYAGIVTRLAAFAIDAFVATTLYAITGAVIQFVWSSLLGGQKLLSDARIASALILAIWLLIYFAYPLAVSGRTLGMAVVGLQVVTKDGGDIGGKHAIIRTLVLPFSVAFVLIGVLIMLFNRDRRALHDLIAGTAVVYSWNARAARMRFLAKRDT
jgi:uncharacterized RDD family membrane protein YckC